jgi:hypothetical protein
MNLDQILKRFERIENDMKSKADLKEVQRLDTVKADKSEIESSLKALRDELDKLLAMLNKLSSEVKSL